MTNTPTLIPADLIASIERQTHASITKIIPRGGGGASRQGAEVTIRGADGRERRAYLAYDTRAGDPQRLPFFRRETSILRALSGPLVDTGVMAPRLLASEPAHLASLTQFTEGLDRFASASDQLALARDFVGQLAALHRIDPRTVELEDFGDPGEGPASAIRSRVADLKAQNLRTAPDPILQLALLWLTEHVPEDRGPSVILHGDAGPGNFLHQDNKVTALLDWELTHLGDPMEDLAQIWVRSMIQPFVPMREVFAAYEAAGGVAADLDRVRFHRLYFQLSFTVGGHAALHTDTGVQTAMLGASLMFNTAHMRVIVQSLAELTGQSLERPVLPAAAASHVDRSFEIALQDLRETIVPRLDDQHASAKAKSLARLVKWWRARDRYGAAFERAELDEIADLVGERFERLLPARAALTHAILNGRVDRREALQACFNRVTRETALMADSMGTLATTYFPPLDGAGHEL